MLKHDKLTIFAIFLTIFIGANCIYLAVNMISDPESIEKGYVLAHYNNIFIKYSLSFCLGYFGFICIIYPFLMVKNIMSLGEFLVADERTKSKIYLIVHSLCLPGIVFLLLTVYYSKYFPGRFLYLAIILFSMAYVFVKNSYIYFIKDKAHNEQG